MLRRNSFVVLALLLASPAVAQGAKRSPLEGTWKVASVSITGPDTMNVADAQPGLFIFARTHYSAMWTVANKPRATFKAGEPTAEEKAAAFDSFVANSGTYEVAGSTVTLRPMIARVPNCADHATLALHFKREGKTLWLTQKSTDVNCRFAGPAPADEPVYVTRVKLVRVE